MPTLRQKVDSFCEDSGSKVGEIDKLRNQVGMLKQELKKVKGTHKHQLHLAKAAAKAAAAAGFAAEAVTPTKASTVCVAAVAAPSTSATGAASAAVAAPATSATDAASNAAVAPAVAAQLFGSRGGRRRVHVLRRLDGTHLFDPPCCVILFRRTLSHSFTAASVASRHV